LLKTGYLVTQEKNWKTFEDWPIYKLFDKPKIIDTDKKYSILIVEDDIDVLHYLTHFFNSEYQVMPAENGKVAHNLLKQYKVDLIISDYMMPDFDGLDLYRSIREDEEFRAIPFIIITAKTDEKLKKDALQEGILDYIEKPFSISILKAKVRSFVDFHAMLEENKAIDIDSLKQSHFQKITNLNNITEQEKNIIQLTMKGFDRKEIATYLSISHHTVKRHMENIFTKLSVHNKQELVALMVP